MSGSGTTTGTVEEAPLGVRARLAAAWTAFMLLYLYVDYLALYKPGFLDEIRGGSVHDFETGPLFVGLALTLVSVPALMVWASAVLPAGSARPLTLVVAALYVPVSVYNADGESWSYAWFYGFSITVEVLLLAYVLRAAWSWPRTTAAAGASGLVSA